jgi:hypothetical protein
MSTSTAIDTIRTESPSEPETVDESERRRIDVSDLRAERVADYARSAVPKGTTVHLERRAGRTFLVAY